MEIMIGILIAILAIGYIFDLRSSYLFRRDISNLQDRVETLEYKISRRYTLFSIDNMAAQQRMDYLQDQIDIINGTEASRIPPGYDEESYRCDCYTENGTTIEELIQQDREIDD